MTSRARRRMGAVLAVASLGWSLAASATPAPPGGVLPPGAPEPPVLHADTVVGAAVVEALPVTPPAPPGSRVVDGDPSDWRGAPTGFGGTIVRSAGELVYQDHLFDAHGADNGIDAQRYGLLDPLAGAVPQLQRIEAIFGADVPGELGVPAPEQLSGQEQYGDLGHQDEADLLELRLAADVGTVYALARTTTMTDAATTRVLLLFDTIAGSPAYDLPFGTGLRSTRADVAVLAGAGGGTAIDLATGTTTAIPAAANATGYVNALEVAVPRVLLGTATAPMVAAAAGIASGDTVTIANAAFRTVEPARTWWDKQQALALFARTVDPFFTSLDLDALVAGTNEHWAPGPGYHDRVFTSSEAISSERGTDGLYQHYGVYLPANHDGTPAPLTFWLHWRGGKAHSAAAVSPGIFRDQGDGRGGIVVSPRGRGSSTWYLGRGHADFLEVWDDVHRLFAIDSTRVYVSGHSMGGWGSYLLSILYPDRFTGAFPVAGPVTQGAWTGLDVEGCDELKWDEYTPCYIEANGSDPRTQHTRPLLDNLRNVPIAIYQGAVDELVPLSGVTRQIERLVELGYRHRYYVFPNYEHYTHPIVDEWAEGVRYLDGFQRTADPARVTYVRSMPFERTVETGPDQSNPVQGLSFDFDHAYWMSELTPTDPLDGVARVDVRTSAFADRETLPVPEVGGPAAPGQVGPYAMTGLLWLVNPLAAAPAPTNGFHVELSGAQAVRFDSARMGLDVAREIAASVTSDSPWELRFAGTWPSTPAVTIDGAPVNVSVDAGVLRIAVPAGPHQVVLSP